MTHTTGYKSAALLHVTNTSKHHSCIRHRVFEILQTRKLQHVFLFFPELLDLCKTPAATITRHRGTVRTGTRAILAHSLPALVLEKYDVALGLNECALRERTPERVQSRLCVDTEVSDDLEACGSHRGGETYGRVVAVVFS